MAGKAQADYGRLLDEAEVMAEGFGNRFEKVSRRVATLVKGYPFEAEVRDLFDRGCQAKAGSVAWDSKVQRYKALIAKQAEEAETNSS